jgi:hypothetical protein
MAHRYLRPVRVMTDELHQPKSFEWRGATYRVEVIGMWHLATRWWDSETHTDRQYFRVQTKDFQTFDLYTDRAKDGIWVLDYVHD